MGEGKMVYVVLVGVSRLIGDFVKIDRMLIVTTKIV